jgi:putative DNA primase/helicase
MSDNDFHILRFSQGNRNRGKVENKEIIWRKFCRKFVEPSVDQSITYAQYLKLGVDDQGAKKSAAGYIVGAPFADGKRRLANMQKRNLISLDLDEVTADQMDDIELGISALCEYEFLRHTSRKHCQEKPRWRIHLPISRACDHDEANAITRILSARIFADPQESIDAIDVVSFRAAQVSYMPTRSKDQEYRCEVNHGAILDVDAILDGFEGDWKDHLQLPMRSDESSARATDPNRKMELPTDKPGILGAWCRTYTVDDCITEFLADIYEPGFSSDETQRYSYLLGSGANGAVSYDDGLFLHSNHGTDPIEGSANAFDLCRIHLFGHLDNDAREGTSPFSMPSYKGMVKFAQDDEDVREELMSRVADSFDDEDEDEDEDSIPKNSPSPKSSKQKAAEKREAEAEEHDDEPEDLDDRFDDAPEDEDEDEDDVDDFLDGPRDDVDDFLDGPRDDDDPAPKKKKKKKWRAQLKANMETGQIAKSLHNINLIFQYDPTFAGSISYNLFSKKIVTRLAMTFPQLVLSRVPIKDADEGREWLDADDYDRKLALAAPENLGGYDIDVAQLDITAAVETAARTNEFHPIRDKLQAASWDGTERAESMFIDYFGVEDHPYHREAARAWLMAAVTRVMEPGFKFDHVPILGGAQGLGKSSFIRIISLGYFGELAAAFDQPTRMVESMLGCWIMEVPELAGFRKAEIETIKQFFSAQEDRVRLAYRRNEETFERQCVFMGSTNKDEYLKDDTGNRRFWPIKCTKSLDQEKLKRNRMMIWAEVYQWYLAKREEQPHGEFHIGLESKAAHTRALLLQEESQAVSPAEIMADKLSAWLNKHVTQEVAEGRVDGQFDDEDDGIALGQRIRVSIDDVWHNGLGKDNDAAPYDLANMQSAFKMIPGWSSERKQIDGKRLRIGYRDGSDWAKKAWEPL